MSAQSKRTRGVVTAAALALLAWCLTGGESPVVNAPVRPVAGHTAMPPRPVGAVRTVPITRGARPAVVADELIVAPRGSIEDAVRAIEDAGGEVAWRAPSTGLLLARFATADDAHQAKAMLAADGRIARTYANHIMTGAGIATSPTKQQQWLLQAMLTSSTSIRHASGIKVAVLDTGAAYESYGPYLVAPDLAGTSFTAPRDLVNDDAHANDDNGHGTHITNIIAASASIAPMAPGATIIPIKVLDASNQGTELALAEGIRYAVDHGAHVINMSLSFPAGYFPSRFLSDAIDYADAQGVVMIAAAGNQGSAQVTYPAAFRSVIAVGASRLSPAYHSPKSMPWFLADLFLVHAEYSNGGNKVELTAPAGSPDGDANGDGVPEAAVAQTFAPGQPTQFEYRVWAGTSQAAAQVSGIAASMIAANPSLTPRQVRAILGESARPELGILALAPTVGRGFVRADLATSRAATESSDARPHFTVALRLGIATSPGNGAVANANVEVLDGDGRPVANVYVYGSFSGAAAASSVAKTNASGIASFTSPPLASPRVVAFQVDAVADRTVAPRIFDRPTGAVRVDSCSLEMLSAWASGQGIATSPTVDVQGIATSPGTTASGSGIATSPSGQPVEGCSCVDPNGIATSPGADGTCPAGTSLLGIATSPGAMPACCIDPSGIATSPSEDGSCPGGTMPSGIATSPGTAGAGIATSPGVTGGGTSLPMAPNPIAVRVPAQGGEIDFVNLLNYSWSGSTMPMAVAAETSWFTTSFPDAKIVTSSGAGLGGSPLAFNAQTSFGAAVTEPTLADGCTPVIVHTFSPAEIADGVSPVMPDPAACGDDASCTAQRATLAGIWTWAATGQGIATSPGYTGGGSGLTLHAFDESVHALRAWSQFATQAPSSPVSQLGDVLDFTGIATSPGSSASGLVEEDGIATSPGVTITNDGSVETPAPLTPEDQALIDWLTQNSTDAAAAAAQ
jgi:Subtilase family